MVLLLCWIEVFVTKKFYKNDYPEQIPFLQKSSPSRIQDRVGSIDSQIRTML